MTTRKYRERAGHIQAMQLGSSAADLEEAIGFVGGSVDVQVLHNPETHEHVMSLTGDNTVNGNGNLVFVGNWVTLDNEGFVEVMTEDVFSATYEPIEPA